MAIDASSLNIPAVQIYLRSLATFMTSVQENVLNYQWRLQKLSLCDVSVFSYLYPACNHSSYTDLVSLLEESTSVNLSSSGDLPDGSDVDMMFDVMLEALEDRQWRDVWSEAIECICIHSPQLTTLTLMHLTSNKLQLLVLVVGIVRAMQRRQEIIQQDIVYCIESNIGEKERGADILNIVKKRLSALSSPNATQMLTISIREHIVCIPSLLDISM
ncbi:hypothetical protein EON65_12670 [archaeon]|nr:MAG: hypothetical protein EON65_12670 [archaeon]